MGRPAEPVEHGTTHRMAQRCARRTGGRCDPCKAVVAEWMAVFRKRGPMWAPSEADVVAARGRAAHRVAAMYPHLFRALVVEELDNAKHQRSNEVA